MKNEEKKDISAQGDKAPVPSAPPAKKQVLGKKAEKYLREGGNIEDLPQEDAQEDKKKR